MNWMEWFEFYFSSQEDPLPQEEEIRFFNKII